MPDYSEGNTAPWYGIRDSITRAVIKATRIGSCAFVGFNNLTRIEISESVVKIGQSAFDGCAKLADVYYAGDSNQWNKIAIGSGNTSLTSARLHFNTAHGSWGSGTWSFDSGVLTISGNTDDYYSEVTPWHPSYPYQEISDKTTSIVFLNNVKYIGIGAFGGFEKLTKITFHGNPEGIQIAECAFDGCESLNSVYCDRFTRSKMSISTMGNDDFENAQWYDYYGPGPCGDYLSWIVNKESGTLTISGTGTMAAYTENLQPWDPTSFTTVTVQEGVTSLSDYAFYGANVTAIYLPESLDIFG